MNYIALRCVALSCSAPRRFALRCIAIHTLVSLSLLGLAPLAHVHVLLLAMLRSFVLPGIFESFRLSWQTEAQTTKTAHTKQHKVDNCVCFRPAVIIWYIAWVHIDIQLNLPS